MKIRAAVHDLPFPLATLLILTTCTVVHALVLPARRTSTGNAAAGCGWMLAAEALQYLGARARS